MDEWSYVEFGFVCVGICSIVNIMFTIALFRWLEYQDGRKKKKDYMSFYKINPVLTEVKAEIDDHLYHNLHKKKSVEKDWDPMEFFSKTEKH